MLKAKRLCSDCLLEHEEPENNSSKKLEKFEKDISTCFHIQDIQNYNSILLLQLSFNEILPLIIRVIIRD